MKVCLPGAVPKGEFLSLANASPVYVLFGKDGIEPTDNPELNHPIRRDVAYKIRPGKHDIAVEDWNEFLKFSDLCFRTIYGMEIPAQK